MKKLFVATIMLSSTVNAQVVECPDRLPSKEITLSEASRDGQASLFPSLLSSAGMQAGELHGQPVEVPPPGKKTKEGWETEYRFTPEENKWLVCRYGGDGSGFKGGAITENLEWWGKVNRKSTSCVLRIKEFKHPHAASRWSALATCK